MGGRRKAVKVPDCGSIQGSERIPAEQEKEHEEQQKLIHALVRTTHHFFGGFPPPLFSNVDDPRCPNKITYPLGVCRT